MWVNNRDRENGRWWKAGKAKLAQFPEPRELQHHWLSSPLLHPWCYSLWKMCAPPKAPGTALVHQTHFRKVSKPRLCHQCQVIVSASIGMDSQRNRVFFEGCVPHHSPLLLPDIFPLTGFLWYIVYHVLACHSILCVYINLDFQMLSCQNLCSQWCLPHSARKSAVFWTEKQQFLYQTGNNMSVINKEPKTFSRGHTKFTTISKYG